MKFGLVYLLCVQAVLSVPVLVVELGSDTIRGSVVDLSNPNALSVVDVIIDEQSERRQPSMVGFSSANEPEFGHSAASIFHRTGTQALPGLIRLLGAGEEAIASWLSDFGKHFKTHTTSDADIVFSDVFKGVQLSVNEAISMQLQHFQRIADAHLKQTGQYKEPITHTVLIVPSSFTSAQRKLYSQLATAAGLIVDLVIGDLTAAAVDYGVRNPEVCDQQKTVMMYTLGAHGASAQVVKFGWTGEGDKKVVQVTELESATDKTVGGSTFTARLRDILRTKFGSAAALTAKAEAKLLKAAAKAKHTLSVGPKAQVAIEELSEGRDLKTEVSVDEFNDALQALLPGCVAPIKTLLTSEISGIEMVGGGWRVPAVRKAVEAAAGSVPVGRHVDSDEGIVLGASTLAAVFASELDKTPMPSHLPSAKVEQRVTPGEGGLVSGALHALTTKLGQWKASFDARIQAEVARNHFSSSINALREALEEAKKLPKDLKEEANKIIEAASAFDVESAVAAALDEQRATVQKVLDRIESVLSKERSDADKKSAPKKDKEAERKKAEKQRDREAAIKKGKADSAKKQKEAEARKVKSKSQKKGEL